ncbi:MAG TPA: helix-turn-helix domain-containing protein [Stellaceae bacterium]|nr:helix-turn-helix domain-containing protein [Stellaceae bacterium]
MQKPQQTKAQGDEEPELLYAARLQRRLGISDVTLWRWRHDERLGFPKGRLINRRVYFPWHEVVAWLDRQQVA